ncbi:MAG: DUF3025 domain-containing protein [Pseudomonadota bacterium]
MKTTYHPALAALLDSCDLSIDDNTGLSHALLNQVIDSSTNVRFVSQDDLPEDEFYELFIHRTQKVPTRSDSWHDVLNGLIWYQYPTTKALLNRLHVQHIGKHGLHPRGAFRDKITHFDECGLVIFWQGVDPTSLMREHKWKDLFCTHRKYWFDLWQPVVFGHALFEMLLTPYIGITAKTLCIEYSCDEFALSARRCDELLSEYIQRNDVFKMKKPLLPLPLLGVPGWHFDEQDNAFYENTDYFMPKRLRITK